jgi:hypothetical protein
MNAFLNQNKSRHDEKKTHMGNHFRIATNAMLPESHLRAAKATIYSSD